MSKQSDVKTIHEFLADNPNVDVSRQWERCWDIHGRIADRIIKHFGATLHPISKGAEYYASPDQQMEGAFFGYTAKDVDWFVRSWLGNRKASIIDMNINVCAGPGNPGAQPDDHLRHGARTCSSTPTTCPAWTSR